VAGVRDVGNDSTAGYINLEKDQDSLLVTCDT
jgi:hypothetical protein